MPDRIDEMYAALKQKQQKGEVGQIPTLDKFRSDLSNPETAKQLYESRKDRFPDVFSGETFEAFYAPIKKKVSSAPVGQPSKPSSGTPSTSQLKQKTEVPELNPTSRMKLYNEAIVSIQRKTPKLVESYNVAVSNGNKQEAAALKQQIEENSRKIDYFGKAIEGQKTLMKPKEEPDTLANNLSIGSEMAMGYLAAGVNFADDFVNQLKDDVWSSMGIEPSEKMKKEWESFQKDSKSLQNPSDVIAQGGKAMLVDANERTKEKMSKMPYGGSPWEALKAGDKDAAFSNAASGFTVSLPSSLLMVASPMTSYLSASGMAQENVEEYRSENGGKVTGNDYIAGSLKAGAEYAFENMMGNGKALKDLVKELGKEGAEKVVQETLKTGLKSWAKEVGLNWAEETAGEGLTQITQNMIDKSMGKNIGYFDGVEDATIIGLFGGGTQGTGTVTLTHIINRRKAKAYNEKKNKAQDLQSQAITIENPVAREAVETEAEKLNDEANEIAEKENELSSNIQPELANQITQLNTEIDELEAVIPTLDPNSSAAEAITNQISEKESLVNDLSKEATNDAKLNAKANEDFFINALESMKSKEEVSAGETVDLTQYLKGETNDKENEQGVRGGEREGQTAIENESEQGTSGNEAQTGGVVQKAQEEVKEPTAEQKLADIKAGNTVTFEYGSESEVPDVLKDKISSEGTTNGKTTVKVTLSKVEADYLLQTQKLPISAEEEAKHEEDYVAALEAIKVVAPELSESEQDDAAAYMNTYEVTAEEAVKEVKEVPEQPVEAKPSEPTKEKAEVKNEPTEGEPKEDKVIAEVGEEVGVKNEKVEAATDTEKATPKQKVKAVAKKVAAPSVPSKSISEWKKEALDAVDKAIKAIASANAEDVEGIEFLSGEKGFQYNQINDKAKENLAKAGVELTESGKIVVLTPKGYLRIDPKNLLSVRKEINKISDSTKISNKNTKLPPKSSRDIELDLYEPTDLEEAKLDYEQALETNKRAVESGNKKLIELTKKQLDFYESTIKALENLKADTNGKMNAFGIIPAVWNAGIDTIILGIKAGKVITEAIEDGIAYLKGKVSDLDENAVRVHLNEKLGVKPETKKVIVNGKDGEITGDMMGKPIVKTEEGEFVVEPEEVQEVVSPPELPKAEAKSDGDERGKRRFTKQYLNEYPRMEGVVGEDVVYYERMPNDISIAEANAVINSIGVDEAIKAYSDFSNNLKAGARMTMGQILLKRLQDEGKYDEALDLLETIAKRATEYGQEIQALALFSALTPQGAQRQAIKQVEKAKEKKKKADKKVTKKVSTEMRKANAEAAKAATESEAVKKAVASVSQAEVNESSDTEESEGYGEKNRIVTKKRYQELKKAMKGKLFSNIPPELIEMGAYHLEAGTREFLDFSKKMVRAFGVKVKPYLEDTYKAARQKLVDAGMAETDFNSDGEIRSAVSSSDAEKMVKGIGRLVGKGIKSMEANIADIAKAHYTEVDFAKKSLVDKIMEGTDLLPADAAIVANAIEAEFNKRIAGKKEQIIKRIAGKAKRADSNVEGLIKDIIDLTNTGGFDDTTVAEAWANNMGYPKLTPQQLADIQNLAEKVQSAPEGLKRMRAMEDLAAYQMNLKGVDKMDVMMSIWYANILSGYQTQEVNFLANLANIGANFVVGASQKPTEIPQLFMNLLSGFGNGLYEGAETLRTGYSPIRGKVEMPGVLERTDFTGWKYPANAYKYVGRLMKAADVFAYEGLKEMRAYQLASNIAAKEGKSSPNQSIKDRAAEIMGQSSYTKEAAITMAEAEYQQELTDLRANTKLTSEEKNKKLALLKRDRKRRIVELIEQSRPENVKAESETYAARGTYNYKPEGVLGWVASHINQAKDSLRRTSEESDTKVGYAAAKAAEVMVNFVVPFTNIIANVANESLNYTPVGGLRYAAGKTSATGYNARELTEQEKKDMAIKAIIGSTLMISAYMLSQSWGDDDEPIIEITANGTNDYRKNYELKEQGWQPYSIKIGGKWYSYQYSPFAVILGAVGNIRDYEKYHNQSLKDNGFANKTGVVLSRTFHTFLDQTALSSLNNALNAAMNPTNDDVISDAMGAAKKTATSVVIPNLYTQGAKAVQDAFDVTMKETRGTYFGDVAQYIPVVRNKYYDKLNALGEPISPDVDKFVSNVEPDPIWGLLERKNVFIGVPSPKTITLTDPETEKQRFMTEEEYYNFVKYRGEEIKQYIIDNYDYLESLTNAEAKEEIESVKSEATLNAKYKLLGIN